MNNFCISVPSSKSEFQREIAIALLSEEFSEICFNSLPDDCLTAIRLADQIGRFGMNAKFYDSLKDCDRTKYRYENQLYLHDLYSEYKCGNRVYADDAPEMRIRISGNKASILSNAIINCGESGLALHLFTGILATKKSNFTVEASGTLSHRKQNDLINSLTMIGYEVSHNDFLLPITCRGDITQNNLKIDNFRGSQALSALLIAYAGLGIGLEINIDELRSRDYVSMTIEALARHNVEVQCEDYSYYCIEPNQNLQPAAVRLEACWSSASFWFILAAYFGAIRIEGLNPNSLQPDKSILEVLSQCGIRSDYVNSGYHFGQASTRFKSFYFDAKQCPDLIPNLAVLGAFCEGESIIEGVDRLENKESNRAVAILTEFEKIGIDITRIGNKFIVRSSEIRSARVSSHSDHRITMALRLAAELSNKTIEIDEVDNVSKSYPSFFDDINKWKCNKLQ